MDLFDGRPAVGGGGRASSGGSFYHLSFRSGSRAGGACARAAHAYATREGEYAGGDRDPVVFTESGNMPTWAEDDPASYWDAADMCERANARLYVSADFALPRELPLEDQIELAREFAHDLTAEERLPYTLAVHAGLDEDGCEHNPHAHLMFSERQNDGIDRSRDQWFKRADSVHPERGGAPKSRTFHGRAWVEHARERWAEKTNEALARGGRPERVDHRSYERQGLDREAGEHYGPAAPFLVGRGEEHSRLDQAASRPEDERSLSEIEARMGELEAMREAILRNGLPSDEVETERDEYVHAPSVGRDDDLSWGR